MRQRLYLLLFLLLLIACQAPAPGQTAGRILLWHGWNETETAVLQEILNRFSDIYPQAVIISAAVPADELRERYESTAALGLGPDLLIGPNDWLHDLAAAGLIRSIDTFPLDTDRHLSAAVDTLRYDGHLYGLPLSLRPVALYYNAEMIATPATTLDELLEQAAAGQRIALNTDFDLAFWGVPAFGGQLFDEEGRIVLDQGGFANWLGWLKNAQDAPGMILDRDETTLRNLFVEGRVAYYVGGPEELPVLQEALGETAVHVIPLPAGPAGPAGPLLYLDAILFNSASAPHQTELAVTLAQFLTSAEQNTILLREIGRVPANLRVRVDAQAYPIIAGFAAQARTAVPIPNIPQMALTRQVGNDIYRQVLAGVLDFTQAAYSLSNQVNEAFGFAQSDVPEVTCQRAGNLRVWHSWTGEAAVALERIAAHFSAFCPGTFIRLRAFTPEALPERLAESANENGLRPDLIIASHNQVLPLAEAGLIQPITRRVDAGMLQRYVPAAPNALRLNNDLYGLPVSLHLNALYYNNNLVEDPPAVLDDLRLQAVAGNTVALPIGFTDAFWGIRAFGNGLFDESYRVTLEPGGLLGWLTWLQTVQETAGVFMEDDAVLLQALFAAGGAAYYVGPPDALGELQARLGQDVVQVVPLPAGPAGEAGPLLLVDAFLFNATLSDAQTDLALAFAAYATNVESQTLLMEAAHRVPANVNVDTSAYPAIAGFQAQVQTAVLWPNVPQMAAVLEQGRSLYNRVLSGQLEAVEAACRFAQTVNQANNFSVESSDLPTICHEP